MAKIFFEENWLSVAQHDACSLTSGAFEWSRQLSGDGRDARCLSRRELWGGTDWRAGDLSLLCLISLSFFL